MDYRERIADDGEAARAAIQGAQTSLWTAIPGIVQSTSLGKDGKMTGEVQPAIQIRLLAPDGTRSDVSLPLLVDVPIIFPHGGPYALTFPVAKDDECLIIFSSRCIDNWWQSGGVQPQHELRLHDLSDGFALCGPYSQKTKLDTPADKTAQFRSVDGKLLIELDNDNKRVNLASDTIKLVFDYGAKSVALSGSDTVEIDANTSITLKATTVTINGDLTVSGAITANGEVTAKSGAGHVTLSQHRGHTATGGPPTAGT